jgi:hypothetical protein
MGMGEGQCTYDVFISYSHKDEEWVWQELLPRLKGAGLRVCIDMDCFEIGTPILTNIERAVDASRHTLLVLTPNWVGSEWADFESLLVGTSDPAGRRAKLLPLMLSECAPPARIRSLTHADFRKPQSRDAQFSRLIQQVRSDAASPPPTTNALSPFVAGPPIAHPAQFFGRTREIRRLFNLWRNPPLQNGAVVGIRRGGKTSLLLYLKSITTTPPGQLRPEQRVDWLSARERYRWIFVDFQDSRVASRQGLLRYLLEQFELPIPEPCDLDHFMEVVSYGLRTPTVVLLDEIGAALHRCPELDDAFWEGLRSLATNQVGGNLGFVLAAHESPLELAYNMGRSSPFFNIFGYTATLGPLAEGEARELIASSPRPFDSADADWILEQSGRWPMLVQILCRERLLALEDGEVGHGWRADGLAQLAPFRHLLAEG